jgi:uncharacterized protein (TIGR00369 family)
MAIWKTHPDQDLTAFFTKNTLIEALGIDSFEFGDDYVRARMPVDHRHVQPDRILHGGATVALAETLGSIGANLCVDMSENIVVGVEINANHIRSVGEGLAVIGTARPLHIGGRTQVWEIRVEDEAEKRLVCISRLTLSVIRRAK